MTKRILAVVLIVLSILNLSAAVFAAEGEIKTSNITFFDTNGKVVEALSEKLTAKVEIIENTSGKKPVLLVCSYKAGMLNDIWHATAESNTGEIAVTFTPEITEDTVIKATVLGSLETLSNPSVSAEATLDSIELSRIMINGEILEDYSNDKTVYLKKVTDGSELNISAIPVDGGTKVEIEEATTVPGVSKVKLTSATGEKVRDIDIITYSDVAQLSVPTKLSYIVDGETFEIEDFDPNIKEYEVTLPDNTFYVTVDAEALIADISVGVKDINHKEDGNDVVKTYFPGEIGSDYKKSFAERPSVNNLIPIKNEETHAIVNVEYNGTKVSYTIIFKAKQPRFTEFNITGAADDTYKPMFISGAAVNNDNGTNAGSDKYWSLGNVPEKFVGGSLIALSTMWFNATFGTASKPEPSFLQGNTTGEFFNFTADTPGTMYYFSRTETKLKDHGWVSIKNVEKTGTTDAIKKEVLDALGVEYSTGPAEAVNALDKTNGNYADDKNIIIMYEWPNVETRYSEDGLYGTKSAHAAYPYVYVYKKTFDKDTTVSVPHPGITGSYQLGDIIITWDLSSTEGGNTDEN